jgi:hypothetical protein
MTAACPLMMVAIGRAANGRSARATAPRSGNPSSPGLLLGSSGHDRSETIERPHPKGMTLAEIAVNFDVATSTIRSCVLRRGVTMRPAARRTVA